MPTPLYSQILNRRLAFWYTKIAAQKLAHLYKRVPLWTPVY